MNKKLSEAQKVALLLVSLGESSVKMIAPYLSREEFKAISQQINELEEVNPRLVKEVVEEFYEKLMFNQIEMEKESNPIQNKNPKDILTILHNADTKQLAEYLRNEPMQAIITMLSYLEPIRAGAIISEFPWEQQCEIMNSFEETHSHDTSTALYRLGSAKFTAEILNHLSQEARIGLLEAISLQNPKFFQEISQHLKEKEAYIESQIGDDGSRT